MFSCLFFAALLTPAGEQAHLLALLYVTFCVFVIKSFPCRILGQVWCLIVSIPDLCFLSKFYEVLMTSLHGAI